MRGIFKGLVALIATGLLATTFALPAQAANTRVSITNFSWSQQPTIDLGESVTWDWLGPDLQHSVTGQAPNATQWDSNPNDSSPFNPLGRSFTVKFDQPGKYLFICKLHPQAVRGFVTVTNQPGDPDSDPGPQAPLNFDLEPPQVEGVMLNNYVLGPKGNGTMLNLQVSEKSVAAISYYKLVKVRQGKKTRTVQRFAGYHERNLHIGINRVHFANRSTTFKPQAGQYIATVRVDDANTNASPDFPIQFEIKGKKKKKK